MTQAIFVITLKINRLRIRTVQNQIMSARNLCRIERQSGKTSL